MDRSMQHGEMSVGVGMLDRDHREMSEALQELHEAATTGRKRSRTGSLLRRLAHFTLTHFALEESMMGATRYPEMNLHRLKHQWLMQQMENLIARSNLGNFILDDRSLSPIAESHLDHVQKDDLHYGLWLNGTGKNC